MMEFKRSDLKKLTYFLWKDGMNAPAIERKINSVLGTGTVSARNCQRTIAKFIVGDFVVDDDVRSGRPLVKEDVEDRIKEVLMRDKYATSRNMAEELSLSHTTILRHLHQMGKQYLANRWLPHLLSEENKANRERICGELLSMHQRNDFLTQLITVDEVWVYWDNANRSYHDRSWYGAGDQPTTSIRRCLTAQKHLATIFWDVKGILLCDVLPRGKNINAELYCTQLDKLVDAIRQKRHRLPGNSFENFHFLQDNARPHTARLTQDKLAEIGFTVLPHPPYSPDLSPSDYYLFSPMKNSLRGKTYHSAEEVNGDLEKWFASKHEDFYANGIKQLPERWKKCVDLKGDYFQHFRSTDE